jgi:hypothetical protein
MEYIPGMEVKAFSNKLRGLEETIQVGAHLQRVIEIRVTMLRD